MAPVAGPVLLGYLLNWGLYGVLSVQVFLYHISFPRDKWVPKALVYTTYVIETAQTVLITHDCFHAYAQDFGNLAEVNAMQNEWLTVPVFCAIVSCTVQMYYAYRLQLLSGSMLLRLVVSVIALVQGVAGLVAGAQAFIIGNFTGLASKAFISTGIWHAGGAVCDVTIAVCMAYYLSRRDTGVPVTHVIVVRLVRLIVETGCLTALSSSIDLILYFSFPHNAYHACVALILTKLYSNSLLVIFNSRIQIVGSRNWMPDNHYLSYSSSDGSQNPAPKPTPVVLNPRAAATALGGIRVDEEIWVNSDNIQMKNQRQEDGVKARDL